MLAYGRHFKTAEILGGQGRRNGLDIAMGNKKDTYRSRPCGTFPIGIKIRHCLRRQ